MTSYGGQLMGKDDNDNTLIISSMTSLTMTSADITGDSNFGTSLMVMPLNIHCMGQSKW